MDVSATGGLNGVGVMAKWGEGSGVVDVERGKVVMNLSRQGHVLRDNFSPGWWYGLR